MGKNKQKSDKKEAEVDIFSKVDELLGSKLIPITSLKRKHIDIETGDVIYSVGGKNDLEVSINLQDPQNFTINVPEGYELKGEEDLFCYALMDMFNAYKQKTEIADALEAKVKKSEALSAERGYAELTRESEEAFDDYILSFKLKNHVSKLNELIEDERNLGKISPEIAEKLMIKTEQTLGICILPREEYLEHVKIEYKGHALEIEGFYPQRGIVIINDMRRRIKSVELYELVCNAYAKSKLNKGEKNAKKE